MKKTIVITLLLIVGSFTATAQSDAFKADAVKLIKMSNGTVEASLGQLYTMIPEAKVEGFKKDLQPILNDYYEKLATKSMEYYTHDEVKQLLKFYNSELGKKSLIVSEKMTKESLGSMAQELQVQLTPLIQKYMGQ